MYSLNGAILHYSDLSQIVDLSGKISSFKVIKNQDVSKVNYNLYQCVIDIDEKYYSDCISNTIIIKIDILEDKNHLLTIYISPDTFDLVGFNDRLNTYKMNIIGPSVIGSRLKNEQQFSSKFNYNQLGGNPNVKTTDYANYSIYEFLTDTILTNAMESYYGQIKKDINIMDSITNPVTISTMNFSTLEDYKIIKTLFWDYLAVLDYPLFSIDDFFLDKSNSIKINLTSLNTILDKNNSYSVKDGNILDSAGVSLDKVINDLPSTEMYKRSIANYNLSTGGIPKIDKYDGKVNIPIFPRKDTIALTSMDSPYYYKVAVPLDTSLLNTYRKNMENGYKKFGSSIVIVDKYYKIGSGADIGTKIKLNNKSKNFIYIYAVEILLAPSGRLADNRFSCNAKYKCLVIDPE